MENAIFVLNIHIIMLHMEGVIAFMAIQESKDSVSKFVLLMNTWMLKLRLAFPDVKNMVKYMSRENAYVLQISKEILMEIVFLNVEI